MSNSANGAHRSAPAKINLGLHVLRKRSDGYHDIETVFVRIPWADVLFAEPADDLRLTCSDPALPVDESNLVMRAGRLLIQHGNAGRGGRKSEARSVSSAPHPAPRPRTPGAALHLEKHLPVGAGLGGGSSDAASALLLLNDLWDLQCTPDELAAIAAQIGSDVPFFLGSDVAIGTGRGEILDPLVDPDTDEPFRPPFVLVVAVPAVHVATAHAYSLIEPTAEGRPDLRDVVLSGDLERWRRELVNDFEGPVFDAYPPIREVKAALLEAGAGYASLSGSGAAVYGFFAEENEAMGASDALRETGHRVWHGRL